MKQYIVFLSCNIVGCEEIDVLEMHDDHTDKELSDACWDMAIEYGNSWQPDDLEWEEFEQDLEGYPELYDPKKHDMLRAGGGSFADDFTKGA